MGSNKSVKGIRMRLTKGSILCSPKPSGPWNGVAVGVLLYRKGAKWYYSLTSPHDETGEIVTSIQSATRKQIVGGIEKGLVDYFPAGRGRV